MSVPADVAVRAADAQVDRVFGVARVAQHPDGVGVDAGESTGTEQLARAVAELELDLPGMDEVELLLALVVVAPALLVPRLTIALTPNAVTPSSWRTLRKPGPSPSPSMLATE